LRSCWPLLSASPSASLNVYCGQQLDDSGSQHRI
jgi:hypothetical protein